MILALRHFIETRVLTYLNGFGFGSEVGYATQNTQRVPTSGAYDIFDEIKRAKKGLLQAALSPVDTEVKLTFCRVDVSPHENSDWKGAIEVTLIHPLLQTDVGCFVLTEENPLTTFKEEA